MTKKKLIKKLKKLGKKDDTAIIHIEADRLLIEYINDDKIKNAFDHIEKWYN